jgi:hypothetical protein
LKLRDIGAQVLAPLKWDFRTTSESLHCALRRHVRLVQQADVRAAFPWTKKNPLITAGRDSVQRAQRCCDGAGCGDGGDCTGFAGFADFADFDFAGLTGGAGWVCGAAAGSGGGAT